MHRACPQLPTRESEYVGQSGTGARPVYQVASRVLVRPQCTAGRWLTRTTHGYGAPSGRSIPMSQGCRCPPGGKSSQLDETALLPLFFSTREKLLRGRGSSAVSLKLDPAQARVASSLCSQTSPGPRVQLTRGAQPLPPPQPPFRPVSCFPLSLQTRQLRSRDFLQSLSVPDPVLGQEPSEHWRKSEQNKPPEPPGSKQVERAASSLTFGLSKVTCQAGRGGASRAV